MKVTVERLHKSATFAKAHDTDAGYDLTCVDYEIKDDGRIMLNLGVRVKTPQGYYWDLRPRSSFSKSGFIMPNSPGTIDEEYRGTIYMALRTLNGDSSAKLTFKIEETFLNDKPVAQMVLKKREDIDLDIQFEEVDTDTERGEGGFGSTDKKKVA